MSTRSLMRTRQAVISSRIERALLLPRMRVVVCFVVLFGATACAPDAALPASSGNLRAELPSAHDMLAQVRVAGVAASDGIDVTPLRDPQVADLRERAGTLEAQSDVAGAAQAIAQALVLVPGDPELLQQAAEYALYQQDWVHAEAFAQQSYERGPKLGSLCRRNWTTLRFARLARGDAMRVQAAIEQLAVCTIAPPVRM